MRLDLSQDDPERRGERLVDRHVRGESCRELDERAPLGNGIDGGGTGAAALSANAGRHQSGLSGLDLLSHEEVGARPCPHYNVSPPRRVPLQRRGLRRADSRRGYRR